MGMSIDVAMVRIGKSRNAAKSKKRKAKCRMLSGKKQEVKGRMCL
jgi:hypothetical protein